ncbi:MAG: GGDEF domain-containing phosphodiesterase [Sphaerochaetaceae bacterium]|nr:GGDEF domain-containing phosphodiesterase [Sphaerochaetaceae bacterium]
MLIYHLIPEVISLLLYLITTIYVLGEKEVLRKEDRSRFFRVATWASLAIIQNLFASLLVMGVLLFPLWLNYIMQSLYYIFVLCLEVSMFDLVFGTIRIYTPNQKRIESFYIASRVIALLGLMLILLNLKTGEIFSLEGPEQIYVRGPLNVISAVSGSLMILIVIVSFLLEKDYLPPQFIRITGYMPLFTVIIMFIQIFFRNMQLTGLISFVVAFFWLLNIASSTLLTDTLTGLGNDKLMMSSLSYFFEKHIEFSLFIINIRNLEKLRRDLGSRTTDNLLIKIANKLNSYSETRQVFRVPDKEKFTIFGPAPSANDANIFCKQLIEVFSELWHVDNSDIALRTDITMIPCPVVAADVNELLRLFNYIGSTRFVSNNESNNVVFNICDLKMKERIYRQEYVLSLLTKTLESGAMLFSFQPIFNIDGVYDGYAECLARLYDPKTNILISPKEFIPIAEKEGLIRDVGKAGLEASCKIIKEALDSGIEAPIISVNFSARQFYRKNIVSSVLDIMEKYGVPSKYIKIEITESYLIENFDIIKKAMLDLGNKGIGFYLDDFGSGYSSISRYLNLPFECIKLDHTLLAAANGNERSDILLKAIIPCFKELGYKIIFEGVEKKEIFDYVKQFGDVSIQGFYFSKPYDVDEFCKLIRGMNE